MVFLYQGLERKSGIYQIKNLISGTVYIGSAKRFKYRWRDHQASLLADTHHTKYLQNAYKKYLTEVGNDDFLEFSILEVMERSTKEERLVKEEWWIQKFVDDNVQLYNINRTPTKESKSTIKKAMRGKRLSPETEYKPGNIPWTKENGHGEETRKLIGKKSKAIWKDPIIGEKMRQTRRTKEFRDFQSQRIKKSWVDNREKRLEGLAASKEIRSEKARKFWEDPEHRERMREARNKLSSKQKRLTTEIGEEKAAKILDPVWMKEQVELNGKKGTALLLGVDVGTISRWYKRHFPELEKVKKEIV